MLTVANRGNVALDVTLEVTDPEKALSPVLEPSRLTVGPGAATDVLVTVRARG